MEKIKILYAAGNTSNSKIQLSRFLKAIADKPYTIKVAAYKNSSPSIHIDWTLDYLLNIFDNNHINLNNDSFRIYLDQIKLYNPDLIISDLEYFTSYAANLLDITLWQCSSSIINFALDKKQKYNMGIFKNYSYIFNKNPHNFQRIINIIDNSNCKFIYSHFGDTDNPPSIQNDFEWIRPYYKIGKTSINCKHNIVAGFLQSNKYLINKIKKYEDVVIFSDFCEESYSNITLKNLNNESEYFCNLKNSNMFICEGQTSFLADAFYNYKKPLVITNYNDTECIINSIISKRLGLSDEFLSETNDNIITNNINPNIKYLHEKISEYI
jgi:uncharacterized protein (TIGR00661 family)